MESPLTSVFTDSDRYHKGCQLYLQRCSRIQRMHDFMDNLLPDVMSSSIDGKPHINVIGVGSGSGELDLKVLSALHLKNPDMKVDYEVVEPIPRQLSAFKDLVSKTPGLDYIKWNWNNMTIQEFEKNWKEKEPPKKADLIHMFEVLYYVEDRGATVSFFQGLLNNDGKLLVSLLAGDSGWSKLDKTYGDRFRDPETRLVVIDEIKQYLDSRGVSYQSFTLPSEMDITACFTEDEDEEGELMLDFITEVLHFRKSAPPDVTSGVLELLHHPDCSVESNGKIMLNTNIEVIVVGPLI